MSISAPGGRPDHLHAYRLGQPGRRGDRRAARFIADKYGKDQGAEGAAAISRPRPRTRRRRTRRSGRPRRRNAPTTSPPSTRISLLYSLIWKRTVACQMVHATIDTVAATWAPATANVSAPTARPSPARASSRSTSKAPTTPSPAMTTTRCCRRCCPRASDRAQKIRTEQHFYRAAAALQRGQSGHGDTRGTRHRPPIDLCVDHLDPAGPRICRDGQEALFPTDVGRVVNKFLTNYFTQHVDYDFTARLEDELTRCRAAKRNGCRCWRILAAVQRPRRPYTRRTSSADVTQEKIDEQCPEVRRPAGDPPRTQRRVHRLHQLPGGDYTRNLDDRRSRAEPEKVGRHCPECGSNLVFKQGRYGPFIGCSGYPQHAASSSRWKAQRHRRHARSATRAR